jgi:hypothetical protein
MENIDFDWLDGDYALNYEFSTSSSPKASLAAERVDQPSGEHALPLLRLSGWKSDKRIYSYSKGSFVHSSPSSPCTARHISIRVRVILLIELVRSWGSSIMSNLLSERCPRRARHRLGIPVRMWTWWNLEGNCARHWILPVTTVGVVPIRRISGTPPLPPNDDEPYDEAYNDDESNTCDSTHTSFESCRLRDRDTGGVLALLSRLVGCAGGPSGCGRS